MPGWFFRCPKKGSGMIFDAPSENQLLSFSTGCGEYQFSDILCMSPPSNALTSAVKLELSHRNAIVGIIWNLWLHHLNFHPPILGKLAFFDYFDGFDMFWLSYLLGYLCVFFFVCSTYLRLGMHHSFAMLIIHPIPSIHVVMYSSTDSRMAVFFWWQIRGTAELPPPPPLRLLYHQ
jgi:hypothetical protein